MMWMLSASSFCKWVRRSVAIIGRAFGFCPAIQALTLSMVLADGLRPPRKSNTKLGSARAFLPKTLGSVAEFAKNCSISLKNTEEVLLIIGNSLSQYFG